MPADLNNGFHLRDWQVYPLRNVLVGPAGEVRIEPKVMQVLERLAAADGEVVSRDQLLEELWHGRAMSDEPLTRCVATLRKVLDDSAKEPAYIQTIPKHGYRLVCPVESLESEPARAQTPPGDQSGDSRSRLYLAGAIALLAAVAFASWQWRAGSSDDTPRIDVVGPSPAQLPERSIAVLPFANLSPDPANEYLSDGLAAELMDLLTEIPDLKVAARTSAFAFKGRDIDVTEMARQLRVAYVLSGSVRQSQDVLRISAQLIDASDGYQVWSNTWESEIRDIFEIQDEIAGAVVETLRFELLGGSPTTQRADPEAYALYLQSGEAWAQTAEPDIGDDPPDRHEEALALITHALAIDPDYAPAWSRLAGLEFSQAQWTTGADPSDAYARARAAAERALSIDPGQASALRTLGHIDRLLAWDTESAATWYRRALLANPGDPATLDIIGGLYRELALPIPAYTRDVPDTDPLNPVTAINLALRHWGEGNPGLAREQLEVARSIAPNAVRIRTIEAVFDYLDGDYEKAIGLSGDGLNPEVQACAHYAIGRSEEAQSILLDLKAGNEFSNFGVAAIQTCFGDHDAAFAALESAYVAHDQRLRWLNTYLLLQPLSDDPRWDELRAKVGISEDDARKVIDVFADVGR